MELPINRGKQETIISAPIDRARTLVLGFRTSAWQAALGGGLAEAARASGCMKYKVPERERCG